MTTYSTRLWSPDSQPQYWSKYQVWEWLQQMLDMHQIDPSGISFQNFDVDGRQLCSMTFQDFTRAAGSVGPILYQNVNELKWSGGLDEGFMGRGRWGWQASVGGSGALILMKEMSVVQERG